jgi:hypothetical protein
VSLQQVTGGPLGVDQIDSILQISLENTDSVLPIDLRYFDNFNIGVSQYDKLLQQDFFR